MIRLAVALVLLSSPVLAQRNGQPASDVLGSLDLNGNPAFMGGVTNGGPNAHSVW